jgi:hypothetical protein
MALVLIFSLPITTILLFIINLIKPGHMDINLNIDEDLGNYFEALEQDDKNMIIKEEENLRRNYKMKTMIDDTLERLRRAKTLN